VFLFSSLSCSPSWWRSSLTSFQPSSTQPTTSWASWRSLQPHVESVKHDKTSINSQSTPLSSLRRTLRSSSPWISLCSWLHRSHQRLRSSWRAIVAFLERLRLLATADFTMAASSASNPRCCLRKRDLIHHSLTIFLLFGSLIEANRICVLLTALNVSPQDIISVFLLRHVIFLHHA
jgi:hypothetical protein